MTLQECYARLNGNYKDVLSRLTSERLVDRFLLKFPADKCMEELRAAIAEGDIAVAFRMAHTLKGVCANLGLSGLQQAASALTEQLRPQTEPADPALYAALERAYKLNIDIIRQYEAEK